MIRVLSAEEYPKLKDVAEGFVPDPKTSIAIVSEDSQGINGRTFLMQLTHQEGTWLREDMRGSILGFLLMKRAQQEAKKAGLSQFMAYTDPKQSEITDYMKRLGFKEVPVLVWSKEI